MRFILSSTILISASVASDVLERFYKELPAIENDCTDAMLDFAVLTDGPYDPTKEETEAFSRALALESLVPGVFKGTVNECLVPKCVLIYEVLSNYIERLLDKEAHSEHLKAIAALAEIKAGRLCADAEYNQLKEALQNPAQPAHIHIKENPESVKHDTNEAHQLDYYTTVHEKGLVNRRPII
jgi:hypothetical protein